MKLFKNLLGVIVGTVVAVLTYGIVATIISFVGRIPILGALLYYPADASWALIVMPVTTATFIGAYVAAKIAKTAAPFSTVWAIFWLLNIIAIFWLQMFSWAELFRSLLGIVSSCVCFSMKDEETEALKKTYLVVDKETGEVVDENFKR